MALLDNLVLKKSTFTIHSDCGVLDLYCFIRPWFQPSLNCTGSDLHNGSNSYLRNCQADTDEDALIL